jgi:hypothetical protein
MKNFIRWATSAVLVAAIFGLAIPLSLRSTEANAEATVAKGVKDFKVKKGAEVAAKVRKFKENNENVRAALRYFEKKGKTPKIDEAFAITGSVSNSNGTTALNSSRSFIRPASFTQQSSVSDGNVEIIFVPEYSTDGEWQGTVIASRYDDYGSLVEQYVAESILVMPDPNTYSWDEVYEAPVYGGEVTPPISEPGMYTDYNWGTTREAQPPEYQNISKSNEAASHDKAKFVKAGFVQSRRARVRAWARCSFAWCGGAGIVCVGVNLWNAEILAGPCFAVGCGGSMVGCTWGTLWQ